MPQSHAQIATDHARFGGGLVTHSVSVALPLSKRIGGVQVLSGSNNISPCHLTSHITAFWNAGKEGRRPGSAHVKLTPDATFAFSLSEGTAFMLQFKNRWSDGKLYNPLTGSEKVSLES